MKLSLAIDNYRLACIAEGKRPKTLEGYMGTLRTFLAYHGDMPTGNLTAIHVREYLAYEIETPGRSGAKSSHSIMKYYQVLRTFARWLQREGLHDAVITERVRPPQLTKTMPAILSVEQVKALLAATTNFRDQVIVLFYLDTGCRLRELAQLDLSDINLDQRWARVMGKGGKEAIVPFGRRVARDLHTYIHRHRAAGTEALFTVAGGERFQAEGIKSMLRRRLSDIGIDRKRGAHILRHTFSTHYLRRGGDLETLRRILRHENIATTQIYLHLVDEDVFAAHAAASPIDRL